MRFRAKLCEISQLVEENGLLNMKLILSQRGITLQSSCSSSWDVFQELCRRNLVNVDNIMLLEEVLKGIGMADQAEKLCVAVGKCQHRQSTSAEQDEERTAPDFLDRLSARIPFQSLPSLKLLCNKVLTRAEREEVHTTQELVSALRDKCVVGPANTDFLEALLMGEGLVDLSREVSHFARERPRGLPVGLSGTSVPHRTRGIQGEAWLLLIFSLFHLAAY